MSAYNRLRRAVLAYAAALSKYAQFGSAWQEEAPELDTLWADVLAATEPDFEFVRDPESDDEWDVQERHP